MTRLFLRRQATSQDWTYSGQLLNARARESGTRQSRHRYPKPSPQCYCQQPCKTSGRPSHQKYRHPRRRPESHCLRLYRTLVPIPQYWKSHLPCRHGGGRSCLGLCQQGFLRPCRTLNASDRSCKCPHPHPHSHRNQNCLLCFRRRRRWCSPRWCRMPDCSGR